MIDLNTDSWACVAADKSKKNTHKTELGPRSGSRLPWLLVFLAGPSPFVHEWRDVNVHSAVVPLSGSLVAGDVHAGLKRSLLAARFGGVALTPHL